MTNVCDEVEFGPLFEIGYGRICFYNALLSHAGHLGIGPVCLVAPLGHPVF